MFLDVQNDGRGPAVRSAEAERRAIAAAAAAAFGQSASSDVALLAARGLPPCVAARSRAVYGPVVAVSLPLSSGCELTLETVLHVRDTVLYAAAAQDLAAGVAAEEEEADAKRQRQGRQRQRRQRRRLWPQGLARPRRLRPGAPLQGPPRQPSEARPAAAVVVVTGTDAMEELALALDWLLPHGPGGGASRAPRVACVVTGAMRPASALCPDGPANVRDALLGALAAAARAPGHRRPGVLVAMGGQLHSARHVRKVCSDGGAGFAFSSGPCAGPVGAVSSAPFSAAGGGGGGANVAWAAGGPPPPARLPLLRRGRGAPPPPPPPPPRPRTRGELDRLIGAVGPRDLRTRVLIWTLTADAIAPPDALLATLDGLVLSAPGAGSVPRAVLGALAASPALRAPRRLPVVLASRCGAGPNHDAGLYGERSAAQYEEAGLELWRRGRTRQGPRQAAGDGE